MTRVSENQVARSILYNVQRNKDQVDKFSNQVSTGVAVNNPGDSPAAGTIAQYQETLLKVEGYQNRVANVQSFLNYQEDILNESQDIMTRAKELATQGANETNTTAAREAMAKEVFQLRDHMVELANSQYQGKYIYAGAVDNAPPFGAATYTNPATAPENQRYVYTTALGSSQTKSVNITDTLAVTVNTPGNTVFQSSIVALEQLGRALAGYDTTITAGVPTGGGTAYDLTTQRAQQTQAIAHGLDLVNSAVKNELGLERASVAGRQRRLDTAVSVLKTLKTDGDAVLGRLQNADITEAATNLSQAQTTLEASYTVTSRVLNLSILDYL